jgi:KaiC/GvpD/RAD55 family RecA-like ATPase
LSPARLVVLGEPGAGKTVLAWELLIRLLEHRKRLKRPQFVD